jgi:ELWxxDGT repeat protein
MLLFPTDNGIHGRELWRSDGTDAGTVMVTDLHPGAANPTPSGIQRLTNDGQAVYATSNGLGAW